MPGVQPSEVVRPGPTLSLILLELHLHNHGEDRCPALTLQDHHGVRAPLRGLQLWQVTGRQPSLLVLGQLQSQAALDHLGG